MYIVFGWPQAVFTVLTLLGYMCSLVKDPTPRNVLATSIAAPIIFGLLYWGGFFG